MTTVALILAAALAIGSVLYVALPLLRQRRGDEDELREPTPEELRKLRLLEERDRVLGALHDLEFDRRSEKLSERDYELLKASLRMEAADVLDRLDSLEDAEVTEQEREPLQVVETSLASDSTDSEHGEPPRRDSDGQG